MSLFHKTRSEGCNSGKERELQQMEGEEEKARENNVSNDYCASSLVYDSTFKQELLPCLTPKEKLALDPDYYPPKYVQEEEDNAPFPVNNLVPPPVRDQKKNSERTNKEEEENKELEDSQDMDKRYAEEDSEWK